MSNHLSEPRIIEVVAHLLAGHGQRGSARATGTALDTVTKIDHRLKSGKLADIAEKARVSIHVEPLDAATAKRRAQLGIEAVRPTGRRGNHLSEEKTISVVAHLIAGHGQGGARRATGVSDLTISKIARQLKEGTIDDIVKKAKASIKPNPIDAATEKRKEKILAGDTETISLLVAAHPQAVPTIDATDADILLFGLRALAASKGVALPVGERAVLAFFRETFARCGEELEVEGMPALPMKERRA